MSFELLRDIEHELVDEAHMAYFPPILDEDPAIAAESLTIRDATVASNALKDVYTCITNKVETPYIYLKEAAFYSYPNFIWFTAFFKKLQELYGLENTKIPYTEAPCPSSRKTVSVFPPLYLINMREKYKIFYEELNTSQRSLEMLIRHRTSYIFKGHELMDFRCGFPNWYVLKSTTVFEKYSEKINKRVKISFQDGEFRYFICGASDNWQEILDVPLEIDDVIAALLFKN